MGFQLDIRDEVGNDIGDYRDFENHRAVVRFLDENSDKFRVLNGLWTDVPFWDGMAEYAIRVLYLERFFDVDYWQRELEEYLRYLESTGTSDQGYLTELHSYLKKGGHWINNGTCIYWLRYEDKTTG